MAKLIFRSGAYAGKTVSLPNGKTITLGRNREIELPLPDPKLSRRHCQITVKDDRCFLQDLNSTNGTFVNGARLTSETELRGFDRVVLGDTELEYLEATQGKLAPVLDPSKTPVAAPVVGNFLRQAVGPPAAAPAPEPNMPDFNSPAIQIAGPSGSGLGTEAQRPVDLPSDPLEQALRELSLPLPPEPPANGSGGRPKVVFCDGCDCSIPVLDWDLSIAREFGGKSLCRDCLSKTMQSAQPSSAPGPAAQRANASATKSKSVSDILSALDQEAEVVDTTVTRRGVVVADDQISKAIDRLERMQQAATQSAQGGKQPETRVQVPRPSSARTPAAPPPPAPAATPAKPTQARPIPAIPAPAKPSAPAAPGARSAGSAADLLSEGFEEIV